MWKRYYSIISFNRETYILLKEDFRAAVTQFSLYGAAETHHMTTLPITADVPDECSTQRRINE